MRSIAASSEHPSTLQVLLIFLYFRIFRFVTRTSATNALSPNIANPGVVILPEILGRVNRTQTQVYCRANFLKSL